MAMFIVLTIGEAVTGVIGGTIIGKMLGDSGFGRVANAIIGLIGGVTVGYLLDTTLPDIPDSVSHGSWGAVLGSIIAALVGATVLITFCALVKDNFWSISRNERR